MRKEDCNITVIFCDSSLPIFIIPINLAITITTLLQIYILYFYLTSLFYDLFLLKSFIFHSKTRLYLISILYRGKTMYKNYLNCAFLYFKVFLLAIFCRRDWFYFVSQILLLTLSYHPQECFCKFKCCMKYSICYFLGI